MSKFQDFVGSCEDFAAQLAEKRQLAAVTTVEYMLQFQTALSRAFCSAGQAARPLTRSRELLSEAVTNLAYYQILVMETTPQGDATGLGQQHGISGELKPRLLDIASHDGRLRRETEYLGKSRSQEDIWNHVVVQSCRWNWFAKSLAGANNLIEQLAVDESRRWHKPFLHAMCVWHEDRVRRDLGLARMLAREPLVARHRAAAYHAFMRYVLDLSTDPEAKWRAHFKKWIERGELIPWKWYA